MIKCGPRGGVSPGLATQAEIVDAQYNQTLVLFQYFAYLRRDPDESGFAYWLNLVKNKPLRDAGAARSVACWFLNSEEYQSRFGILTTPHHRANANYIVLASSG